MFSIVKQIVIVFITLCIFSCKKNISENNKDVKLQSESTSLESNLSTKKQAKAKVVIYSYLHSEIVGEGEFLEKQEIKVKWVDDTSLEFELIMDNSMCQMKDNGKASFVEENTFKVMGHPVIKLLKFNSNKNEVKFVCSYGEHRDECDPMDNVIMKKITKAFSKEEKNTLIKEDAILEKEEVITYETIQELKKMKFSLDCKGDSYVFFLVGGQFKTKNIFFNSRLKRINESEYYIYYSPPLLDPVPSGLNDVAFFSLSKPIGKIINMEGELEFEWYGFYNRRTKGREFKKNPFTNKIEEGSIVLKWCDIGNVDAF